MSTVEKLAATLLHHETLYREGKAIITDSDYDRLYRQVRLQQPNHPVFEQIKQNVQLAGLDTPIFTEWYSQYKDKPEVVVQPKIDGCAILLQYKEGLLANAWTRKGKDKIAAMLWLATKIPSSLPTKIKQSNTLLVRGELYGKGMEAAKSQRLAAGHLRKKDPRDVKEGLAFAAFEICNTNLDVNRQQIKLINNGFETCGYLHIDRDVESRVKTCHSSWKKSLLFTKYPTDGIVVRLAGRDRQERAEKENNAYDWKIAIKNNW
tara:strand:- start:198 stop:986 length:789 start_codon:yes stop_codon:yes gene_type:complete